MKYAILSQTETQNGTLYEVILEADDGYQETQKYVGDETVLEEACRHFNEERMAQVSEPQKSVTPDFVTLQ